MINKVLVVNRETAKRLIKSHSKMEIKTSAVHIEIDSFCEDG